MRVQLSKVLSGKNLPISVVCVVICVITTLTNVSFSRTRAYVWEEGGWSGLAGFLDERHRTDTARARVPPPVTVPLPPQGFTSICMLRYSYSSTLVRMCCLQGADGDDSDVITTAAASATATSTVNGSNNSSSSSTNASGTSTTSTSTSKTPSTSTTTTAATSAAAAAAQEQPSSSTTTSAADDIVSGYRYDDDTQKPLLHVFCVILKRLASGDVNIEKRKIAKKLIYSSSVLRFASVAMAFAQSLSSVAPDSDQ